jgi:hypothetical protein
MHDVSGLKDVDGIINNVPQTICRGKIASLPFSENQVGWFASS